MVNKSKKPGLTLMVGLPLSGKSTYCRDHRLEKDWVIVNPDSYRLALHRQLFLPEREKEVWAAVDLSIKGLLISGQNVVLDATNVTAKTRDKYRKIARDLGFNFQCYIVDTPLSVCIERNARINRMSEDVIQGMHKRADFNEKLEEDMFYV